VAIDKAELAEHRRKWSVLQRRVDETWFRCFARMGNRQSRDYVPGDIFHSVIEPLLNNRNLRSFLANKCLFDFSWSTELFPRTIVRNVAGRDYDGCWRRVDAAAWEARLAAEESVVVKPAIQSGGGRNVQVFRRRGGRLVNRMGETLTRDYARWNYPTDHIVQECVRQHPYFAAFNESSVNTLRVCTYRSVATDEVAILGHIIRTGRPGFDVDNERAGGPYCNVDPRGRAAESGTNRFGARFDCAPSGLPFREVPPVPHIEALRETAVRVAREVVEHRLLGVDLCLDRDGRVRVLEVNTSNIGIHFHQVPDGPLFGPYTDEVIAYCRSRL